MVDARIKGYMGFDNTIVVKKAAKELLRECGLQSHLPKFFCPDGIVVLALLCNAVAKFVDESYYDYKSSLIAEAICQHGNCWQDNGVVYFETSVGQISFHVFDDEDRFLSSANGRNWKGGWMQDKAISIAEAFLNGGECAILEYHYDKWLTEVQG